MALRDCVGPATNTKLVHTPTKSLGAAPECRVSGGREQMDEFLSYTYNNIIETVQVSGESFESPFER